MVILHRTAAPNTNRNLWRMPRNLQLRGFKRLRLPKSVLLRLPRYLHFGATALRLPLKIDIAQPCHSVYFATQQIETSRY